jgi:hypothetical protein
MWPLESSSFSNSAGDIGDNTRTKKKKKENASSEKARREIVSHPEWLSGLRQPLARFHLPPPPTVPVSSLIHQFQFSVYNHYEN